MTNYERGRQYEYKSIRILEAAGYSCTRSAGSKGSFDIIGVCAHGTCHVQVKCGTGISAAELESIQLAIVPPNALKLIHEWKPGEGWPKVTVVR